jgi:antitoxin VapB
MATAKVFVSGNSQAVRLPKEYRLDVDEVVITRVGRRLILEPVEASGSWLDAMGGPLPAEFEQAIAKRPKLKRKGG